MQLQGLFLEDFNLLPESFDLSADIARGMSKRKCIKCNIFLNQNNWLLSCQKQKKYVCKFCNAQGAKDHAKNIKMEVIRHYGGKCVCCKEANIAFLTIDHIDGKGAEHRRSLQKTYKRKKPLGSNEFYRWLKKNNYPKDNYQLLCFNCNCAKHIFGICPHQKKKNKT